MICAYYFNVLLGLRRNNNFKQRSRGFPSVTRKFHKMIFFLVKDLISCTEYHFEGFSFEKTADNLLSEIYIPQIFESMLYKSYRKRNWYSKNFAKAVF